MQNPIKAITKQAITAPTTFMPFPIHPAINTLVGPSAPPIIVIDDAESAASEIIDGANTRTTIPNSPKNVFAIRIVINPPG